MPKPIQAFTTGDGKLFLKRLDAENYEIRAQLVAQFGNVMTPEIIDLIISHRLQLETLFIDAKKEHSNVMPALPDAASPADPADTEAFSKVLSREEVLDAVEPRELERA